MITNSLEFPPLLNKLFKKAIRYEWITFFYMLSAIFFSFMVMRNSQTMKTVWLEDCLGIIPAISFLVCSRIFRWRPTKKFPYGFHKVFSIGFLSSSLALLILGIYLLLDGTAVLIQQTHPNIPVIELLGHKIWFGYLMILALLWSSVPSIFLGHIKIPLAKTLYDKVLYADSCMNKASWKTGFVSIIGIIGIGLGFWWADALVGILISFNIIQDGFSNTKQAILDLIDEIPQVIGERKTDSLINEIKKCAEEESWITEASVRLRDDGHVFFGEVFIKLQSQSVSINKIMKLQRKIKNLHWRLNDIVIMPIACSAG